MRHLGRNFAAAATKVEIERGIAIAAVDQIRLDFRGGPKTWMILGFCDHKQCDLQGVLLVLTIIDRYTAFLAYSFLNKGSMPIFVKVDKPSFRAKRHTK